MKTVWIVAAALLLAGCGTASRATAVAPDAQLSHADGLLSGYAAKVGTHDGKLTLQLVHQGLLAKPVAFDQVFVKLPIGEVGSSLYLGTDHNVYADWTDPLKNEPEDFYVVGSFTGTPALGAPLHYQLVPGARLTFQKAFTEVLTGRHVPDTTVLELKPIPKTVGRNPDLIRG
ncbi:MAG: hypothetical protein JWM80_2435 [Cyanobacteria bacterium RYN_339]|nr:hypothetical protein [Cyanobacteria bacterium RYN_339]